VKKLLLLLLAVATLALLGCPSDAEPGRVLSAGERDFVIKGGGYQVEIPTDPDEDGFVITQGEEYVVTFVILDADEDFFPSHVGGKLFYVDEDDNEGILSGWMFSMPDPVAGPGTYRWTFKAGEANDDDKPLASPATTPADAKQYFSLTAQDTSYATWPARYEFGIKGSITVAKKVAPIGTKTNSGEITLAFGADPSLDPALGKGNIEDAQFTRVKDAFADGTTRNPALPGNGAFLRFYIINCNVTAQMGSDGNAVGNVGNRSNLPGDINPNPALAIPKGTPANPNFSFEVDIEVEVLLDFVLAGESHLFVNMYDAKCSKIELWEYK